MRNVRPALLIAAGYLLLFAAGIAILDWEKLPGNIYCRYGGITLFL